jgi:hypothetical protein
MLLRLPGSSGTRCRCEAHTGYLRHPFVTWIGNDLEQFLDPIAADRRDNPELGEMGSDHIDYCGLLANEQVPRTMEHQAALLPGRLGRDEPHVRPGDRLTDRLRICSIVLLPFDVGLHVGRWHQPHGVAERLEFARPMMR